MVNKGIKLNYKHIPNNIMPNGIGGLPDVEAECYFLKFVFGIYGRRVVAK